MSSYPFNGAGSLDVAIFPDIKVVADPVKSPPAVTHFKVCFREIPVRPRGGTVDHNQVNLPHQPVLSFFYLFSFCERKTGFPIQHLRFCQSSLLIFYKLVIN